MKIKNTLFESSNWTEKKKRNFTFALESEPFEGFN